MKGNSLCMEPEEAKIVRMIYDMYGEQGIGYNTIAYQPNQLNIPALNGKWGQTSVVNILNNEVYMGKSRWRRELVKRVIEDGMLTKKRYTNDNYDLYNGMHEPIITQEMWDNVKAKQKSRGHHSTHAAKELKNPFATILVCESCGAVMKRNVPGKRVFTLWRCLQGVMQPFKRIFRSWRKPRRSFCRSKLSRKPSTALRWKLSRLRRAFWITTTF